MSTPSKPFDVKRFKGGSKPDTADLQGFVRSEPEALSAGFDDCSFDLSSVFTYEESAQLDNAAMELSAVPEALMTVRAATDKMKGKKGEPAVSFSGKGKGKLRKPNSVKQLQEKLAARKVESTCHEGGQRGHWAGDSERRTRTARLGQPNTCCRIVRISGPS